MSGVTFISATKEQRQNGYTLRELSVIERPATPQRDVITNFLDAPGSGRTRLITFTATEPFKLGYDYPVLIEGLPTVDDPDSYPLLLFPAGDYSWVIDWRVNAYGIDPGGWTIQFFEQGITDVVNSGLPGMAYLGFCQYFPDSNPLGAREIYPVPALTAATLITASRSYIPLQGFAQDGTPIPLEDLYPDDSAALQYLVDWLKTSVATELPSRYQKTGETDVTSIAGIGTPIFFGLVRNL